MKTTDFLARSVSLALICTLSVSLWGCSAVVKGDSAELEKLKAENDSLKGQLTQLQTSCVSQMAQKANQPAVATAAAPSTTTTFTAQSFTDLGPKVPNVDMINDLAKLGIFQGVGAEFKPFQPVTRGEYITWLYNAYNAQHGTDKQIHLAPAYKVTFTDISETHPAYQYVQALANAGFSVGYDDKTFRPDAPLTREEMISIKHGTDGGESYTATPLPFADAAQVDKRFTDAIYSDYVIMGKYGPKGGNIPRAFGPVKVLKPKDPVLRYEAAATLWQTDHRGNFTADKALHPEKG